MVKKRGILALLVLLILLGSVMFPSSLIASDIRVTIDGVAVDFEGQPPTIVDGRTLVPVRGVFEALGFDVEWEQSTQTATLTSADYVVVISIGSEVFATNGANHALDVPAQIIDGRTMLPIRAVLESVGLYVDWDGGTSTVLVNSPALVTHIAAPTPQPAYVSDNLQQTVWLSQTGVRYHRIDNCGTMNPNRARSMTRQEARSLGHQACANCW